MIPPGARVLEVGCGTGDLLAQLRPGLGVGLDLSRGMLHEARTSFPALTFVQGDAHHLPFQKPFEFVILSDLLGHLADVLLTLKSVRAVCAPETRVLVTFHNFVWEPVLRLGERVGLKMPQQIQNWLGMADVENLLYLAGFQAESRAMSLLCPRNIPVIAPVANRWLAHVPPFSWACLVQHIVARPVPSPGDGSETRPYTCSVIVPCRNEVGNIEACVTRLPPMGPGTELIFVDGASTDGTVERINDMIRLYEGRKRIRLIHQVPPSERLPTEGPGTQNPKPRTRTPTPATRNPSTPAGEMLPQGKGDAVRQGFGAATGEILMILDADLTVEPDDLPRFYDALAEGKARFVNGSRLVYPLEGESMPFVNYMGNKLFSLVFTWLLGQRIKDTLCGTKALFREDWDRIVAQRSYFGNFDPFGDFDLLFGAARLKLKIVDMPVRYRRRVAGESKVRASRHGWLLVGMTLIGFRKLKLRPWLEWLFRRSS